MLTLEVRLRRRGILCWLAVLCAAGLVYGGLGPLVAENADADLFGGGVDVLRGYLSLMVVMMTLVVGAFAVLAVQAWRKDETRGRVTPVLAAATGRPAWLGSSMVVTAGAAVLLLAATGVATGAGAALAGGDAGLVGELTVAYLVRAPEVLLVLTLAALLFAAAPRAVGAAWAVLVYGGVVRFFASNLGWPSWLMNTSPLQHIPRLPAEDFTVAPVLALLAVAAVLTVLAFTAFRRRDLAGG